MRAHATLGGLAGANPFRVMFGTTDGCAWRRGHQHPIARPHNSTMPANAARRAAREAARLAAAAGGGGEAGSQSLVQAPKQVAAAVPVSAATREERATKKKRKDEKAEESPATAADAAAESEPSKKNRRKRKGAEADINSDETAGEGAEEMGRGGTARRRKATDGADTSGDASASESKAPAATAWDEDAEAEEGNGGGQGGGAGQGHSMAQRISCTVFLGQLPYSASEADVRGHFKRGGITSRIGVRLLTHRDTGRSRGLAFVELASEADMHTALRLHHSPMDGRRINVERTVGGGGAAAGRKEKLADLRDRQGAQMRHAVEALCDTLLGGAAATADGGGGDGGGDGGEGDVEDALAAPISRADVDERVLEFLITVPSQVAESALKEAKALDMDGVRNRSAYLMGVLKRHVAEADKLRQEREQQRKDKAGRERSAAKHSRFEEPPAGDATGDAAGTEKPGKKRKTDEEGKEGKRKRKAKAERETSD